MVFWATVPKKPQRQALKNWTTGNGLLGTVIMNIKRDAWPCLRISPDRKWIAFSAHDYIYLLDETDKLKDPQGNPVPFRVGDDFLRISWRDGDPLKGIDYQYLLRRVAYKDAQYGHSDFDIYIYRDVFLIYVPDILQIKWILLIIASCSYVFPFDSLDVFGCYFPTKNR